MCGALTAEIVGSAGESEQAAQQSEEMGGLTADSDWHALSQKEEADLDTIMSQCEFAISNAEKFADQLSRDLSVLDGVSVCDVTKMYTLCCYISSVISFQCFDVVSWMRGMAFDLQKEI